MNGTGDGPSTAIYTTYHSLAAATKIIAERDEEIAELIRERDEARALVETLTDENEQLTTEIEGLIEKHNEAEARGFERGVREASDFCLNQGFRRRGEDGDADYVWHLAGQSILALLEPKLSELPHNEGISETAHARSLSPEDKPE
jgi:hypothetical protein